MKIQSVWDEAFAPYGKVVGGYALDALFQALNRTPKPREGILYVPSCPDLEALPVFRELADGLYGGMPIQMGYCNGDNRALNCLEYHRGSELCIFADPVVLLVAPLQKLRDNTIDSNHVEAFHAPSGTAVLLYETTLHYAPCNGGADGFRAAIALPRGTNEEKPAAASRTPEDALLWGRNKWLIAHPSSPEAAQGAAVGMTGENIRIAGEGTV